MDDVLVEELTCHIYAKKTCVFTLELCVSNVPVGWHALSCVVLLGADQKLLSECELHQPFNGHVLTQLEVVPRWCANNVSQN